MIDIKKLTGVDIAPDDYFKGIYRAGDLVFINYDMGEPVFGSQKYDQLLRLRGGLIKEVYSNGFQRVAIHFDPVELIDHLNPPDVPASETDYYQWLNDNHTPGWHKIDDKRKYLAAMGFVIGTDKLSEKLLDTLKAIHQIHFYHNRAQS